MINDQQIYQVLRDRFGFDHFRDGQLTTLQAVLNGQNTLAVLPTGGGKSLLYQLPGYLLPGTILIVSPLLSLMQDQLNRLKMLGEKHAVVLNGQLVGAARQQVLDNLGHYRFVFASPEILTNSAVQTALQRTQVSLMVIDEAHCISQWGPDFRPEYLLLKQIRQQIGQPTCLMVTATATPRVQEDIITKLGLSSRDVTKVIRSVNRPNIFLAKQILTTEEDKNQALIDLVKRLPKPGIIYFASRKQASQMADRLHQETNLMITAYHAGISDLERYRIQQEFMENQINVICATSAFGMGIDKSDLRFVIHYHLPANLESYVQEIGRAGRDGQPSIAILLYANGDEHIQERLVTVELPTAHTLEQIRQGRLTPQVLGEQADLFSFYLQHGYRGPQIIAAFEHRGQQSIQRLRIMEQYLQSQSCLRQIITDYFGEDPQPQATCCSNDQPDWLNKWTSSKNSHYQNDHAAHDHYDWQQRLAKIFKQPIN